MKLFTSAIDKQLFAQYNMGNDLESQKVVAKIFNPYGKGTWYLLNSDPNDPDYIWAIVDLLDIEMGSVSRSELESIKVPPFRLPLERDTSFTSINALELYRGLNQGKRYANGGTTGYNADVEIVENKIGKNYLFPKDSNPDTMGIEFARGGNIKYFRKDEAFYLDGESKKMAMGGQLDVGKYYKTKSGKKVRYLGKTQDPELGTFTNKADGVSKIRYDEIEGQDSLFAHGGYMAKGGEIKKYPKNYKTKSNRGVNPKYNYALLQLNKNGDVLLMGTYTKLETAESQKTFWEKNYAYPQEVNKWVIDELVESKMAKGGELGGFKKGDKVVLKYDIKNRIGAEEILVVVGFDEEKLVLDSTSPKIGKSKNLQRLSYVYPNDVVHYEYFLKGEMAMGGKTFEGKVKSIKKSLLERKKVSPKVQKDYGKTYSPKEAEESAKRIVGSLTAREKMKSKMKK